ncbi:uncharacterized protein si:ch211-13c6.2 isoform X1 [Alosa sapidissima]|uniref:uncharacterized protein si:ch211-13c6.2 isoform X1 n=2 Tax=Alosa sapidissima TaxID=34773 RepID=UPI001C0A3461|nr:uncharacterized protein si:ch211-13c6.2 isoform X1 [Alosa sapidissima]
MADIITTEYDDDSGNDFIQCEYCDKSIRGDTQYRIHLTTSQHLKKKESMNLWDDMPVWESFLDYLDYLKLDEPIIGLSCLEQMESQALGNGQFRLKYKCKMCSLEADLPAMASHVVGRKHRQKFLELHRPDLITWDNKYSLSQQGKVIRAKAEVIERQEGRGKPVDLHPRQRNSRGDGPRRGNAPPNPRFQNPRQNMGPQQGGLDRCQQRYGPADMDIPPQDFPEDPHYQRKRVDDGYYPASTYRSGADYPKDAPFQHGYQEDNDHVRPPFPESGEYGQRYPKDNRYEEPYPEDDHSRRPFMDEPPRQAYDKGDRYEPSYYEDEPRGRPPPGDDQRPYEDDNHSGQRYSDRDFPPRPYEDPHARAYQEETPHQHPDDSYGERVYAERDSSGHLYPQIDHRQPGISEDRKQAYPEEDAYNRRVQEDVERERYGRRESTEWHPKEDTDRRFLARNGSERQYSERGFEPHHSSHGDGRERSHTGYDTERNRGGEARYGGEMPESRMERDWAEARGPPSRPSNTLGRPRSDLPQHQGATHQESLPSRKRRSRFSDCTEAEKELLQKYQMAQTVSERLSQNPPTKVQKHSESVRLREDYRERGGAQQDPANVMDVLKDVQIESVEEANFLKNKLCSLLKEFQANKSGVRDDRTPPMGSRDYEQPRRESVERLLFDEYSQRRRAMAAAGHDRDQIQERPPSDYSYRVKEMSTVGRSHDEIQERPPSDYGYRVREMSTVGRSHDEIQERPPSDDYNYSMREMPAVGRGLDNFHQASQERFDRRSYERDGPQRRREFPRPAEMFEDYPRDDFHRGERRSPPPESSFRFREGSQRSYFDGPLEEHPRDFRPHPAQTHFIEDRRTPPSSLDKIASTLLHLVSHK